MIAVLVKELHGLGVRDALNAQKNNNCPHGDLPFLTQKRSSLFSRHVLHAEYGPISPETWHKRESATRFKQAARVILYPLTIVPNTD